MIDYWQLAKDYTQGDFVQKIDPVRGALSPYMGKVTAVHRGLGVLDIQWPFGNERIHTDEVVKVQPTLARYLPPSLDQSYSSFDIQKARQASNAQHLWEHQQMPPLVYHDLARLWHKGACEVTAYDTIYRNNPGINDDLLRAEVEKFYRVASNLDDLRIQQHATRTAAYWVAQNRQYRVTQQEAQVRRPACPKCGARMKRTTYKMHEGARMRLFACPKDLFLIKQTDLLGPDGNVVEW